MKLFFYGMRLRPAAPGAQPAGLYDIKEDSAGKYWNIISYKKELTPEEVSNYDLDFIQEKEA